MKGASSMNAPKPGEIIDPSFLPRQGSDIDERSSPTWGNLLLTIESPPLLLISYLAPYFDLPMFMNMEPG